MAEPSNAYRGLPLRLLFGFVAAWIVARPLLFDLSITREIEAAPAKMALMGDGEVQPFSTEAKMLEVTQPLASATAARWPKSLARPTSLIAPPPRIAEKVERHAHAASNMEPTAPWPSLRAVGVDAAPVSLPAGEEVQPQRADQIANEKAPVAAIDQWSGSAWLFWRAGSENRVGNNALSPRYGASQAGIRLAYRLDHDGRAEIYGRATAALQSSGQDVAVGLAVKPVRGVNVALAAEYRQALDKGARSGSAIMTYGGFGPQQLGSGWTAEGYAQAGIVGVNKPLGFADGGVRIKQPIAAIGPVPMSVGVGAWAGVQEHSKRVDVGPMVDFDLTSITQAPLRASVDWRQRVVGNAVPDPGIAVTVATDF